MAIAKIKILGTMLVLPAKQHCQFSTFGPNFEVNGLDWQCCLTCSSKTAPRIFFFSIVLGAEYSFLECNNSVLAIVTTTTGSIYEMNDFQYYNYTHLLFRVSDLVLVVAKIMAFEANHSKKTNQN